MKTQMVKITTQTVEIKAFSKLKPNRALGAIRAGIKTLFRILRCEIIFQVVIFQVKNSASDGNYVFGRATRFRRKLSFTTQIIFRKQNM